MIGQWLTGLPQPEAPLDPVAHDEAAAGGLASFLLDQRTGIRHDDGSVTYVDPRGFAIHWQCHGKGLGTTYLMVLPGGEGYGVGVNHRDDDRGDRMTVEQESNLRFRCPVCRRSPYVRGERVLGMLLDLARAYPETGLRRVTAEIRILG